MASVDQRTDSSLRAPRAATSLDYEQIQQSRRAGVCVRRGAVGTGSSFEPSPSDVDALTEHGVAVKEMEAAGVAFVSATFGVPLVCLKAITDVVGAPDGGDDFKQNLERSMAALAASLPTTVDEARKWRIVDRYVGAEELD